MGTAKEPPTAKEKAWAVVRIVLGLAQVMGATLALYLLVQTGTSGLTIAAVVVTGLLTAGSTLLFGGRKENAPRR
jgi:uncharacterized membrane protein (UPF0136 family)